MNIIQIIVACILPSIMALAFFACAVLETAQAHKRTKQHKVELLKLIGRKHF